MGYVGQPHQPIGAAPWAIVGVVAAGVLFLAFKGAKALSSHLTIKPPGRAVKLDGGSSPENMAALVEVFGAGNVQDRGKGIYAISTTVEQSVDVPNGGRVL